MRTVKSIAVWVLALVLTPGLLRADATSAVDETLDAFHAAAANADLDAYLALMRPDMVFLGTDGSERWQGQAWRDFVGGHFSAGRGWTYHPAGRKIALSEGGGIAWFDELLQHDKLGQCRGSGVLVLGGKGWQLAQYNLSVPIPNSMVESVAEVIRASDEGELPGKPLELDPPEEPVTEPPVQKRCRKRFKTNSRADC